MTARHRFTSEVQPSAVDKPVLDARGAAELLGVSEGQLLRVETAGRGPPSFRVGNCKRYLRESLLGWAKNQEGGAAFSALEAARGVAAGGGK